MKQILLQINVKESTYKKLTKYGFMLEKNINDFLDGIAQEIRENEKKIKESKTIKNKA